MPTDPRIEQLRLCRGCCHRSGTECSLAEQPITSLAASGRCPLFRDQLAPQPFTGPARRSCIGHLWPNAANEMWRWNLAQLLQRIDLFNGRRILSVALDAQTVSREAVESVLAGHQFEIHWVTNDPALGEVVSFGPLLEAIAPEISDPNACIFYWHGKGTGGGGGTHRPDIIQEWTRTMWTVCLDRWSRVQEQLTTHHTSGCFRQLWPDTDRLHYSGAYCWVRAQALRGRAWKRIDRDRCGAEKWPGQVFRPDEMGCLFGDQPTDRNISGNLYRELAWLKLRPALAAWQGKPAQPPEPLIRPLRIGLDLDGCLLSHPRFFAALMAAMHLAGHRFYCTSSHGRDVWAQDEQRLTSLGIDARLISPDLLHPTSHGDLRIKARQADQLDLVFDDDLRLQSLTRTPVFAPSVDGSYSFRNPA